MIPFEKLKNTIPKNLLERGLTVLTSESKPIKLLFEQRRVPDRGWKDPQIARLLDLFSSMDSDKDSEAACVGERMGRVASPLVSKLASGFNHGVGSSGDLAGIQPKAAGGSLLYYFANKLATDALKQFGVSRVKKALVLPTATGMSLALALSVARDTTCATEVVYPRIDHNSPLKAIRLVGLKEKIVEGKIFGDSVRVPEGDVEQAVSDNTCAILSTTTFFSPREPDNIKEIAKIAQEKNVPHIINNAYGVQSREIMKLVNSAMAAGRVDAIIQSCDKNFLTPLGGTIVASPNEGLLDKISGAYAGRASAAPVAQFLAAILSLGIDGYEKLRSEQEANRRLLEESLARLAEKYSERILQVYNPVSVAMTLSGGNAKKIGKTLFASRVMGARALDKTDFGVCCPEYFTAYINLDAAIGVKPEDVVLATERLDKVIRKVR
ncbi:MAG: O-phosphoseryl-tRNA(Sec) selenium transferase [Candidatus Bathyarchaeota archaeon]|nr:O-phosphoseryl-tRNA(Sec) selenium transferase [Candidatus Bathyarchaeota archaeon]